MKRNSVYAVALLLAVTVLASALHASSAFRGDVRLSGVIVDDEGNRGVYQPTYNIYEGVGVSLENLAYRWDNGIRLYGNLRNITMNNRNLALGVSKSGLFGVSFRNNQYRRVYSFDGDKFTRRNQTYANAWFQPHKYIKVFGGFGRTNKHGDIVEWFDPAAENPANMIDYNHTYYNMGLTAGHDRSFATFEYRTSDFTDNATPDINDRTSKRFRIVATTMMPKYQNLSLNGGFQHYENRIDGRSDTLTANTAWAGARVYYKGGWSLRYSFIWDRARRTDDLVATDNLSHAVFGDKTFKGVGGITVGYRHRVNDDVRNDLRSNGFLVSGWVMPTPDFTLRAGYGTDSKEVEAGHPLVGKEDRTRGWGSAKYRFSSGLINGTIRLKVEDKSIENDDIGSTADYAKVSSDLSLVHSTYGDLSAGYSYFKGKYENDAGLYEFEEHVISGDLMSAAYHNARAGFGGTYMRSRLDVDVESFTVRFKANYEFMPRHTIEFKYAAYNFDDFNDLSPLYTRYYTSNVYEISLVKSF